MTAHLWRAVQTGGRWMAGDHWRAARVPLRCLLREGEDAGMTRVFITQTLVDRAQRRFYLQRYSSAGSRRSPPLSAAFRRSRCAATRQATPQYSALAGRSAAKVVPQRMHATSSGGGRHRFNAASRRKEMLSSMTQQHTGSRLVDMAGQRIGHLLVLERAPNMRRAAAWRCRCDCGREVVRRGHWLRHGRIADCGRHRAGKTRAALRPSYGHAGARSGTYASWARLIERRRDRVTPAWLSFASFLADMGERPPGTGLRRLDPTLPYQPGNVAWSQL
jgi:hypothetical protein